jgi:hypothetical protein
MVEDFIAEYGGTPALPGHNSAPAKAETTIDT